MHNYTNMQLSDVYEERHALDALHDNTEAAHTTTSAQSGALYNPSIPIDPPKASLSKLLYINYTLEIWLIELFPL